MEKEYNYKVDLSFMNKTSIVVLIFLAIIISVVNINKFIISKSD